MSLCVCSFILGPLWIKFTELNYMELSGTNYDVKLEIDIDMIKYLFISK